MALPSSQQDLNKGTYVPPVATSDVALASYELAWENSTEVGGLAKMEASADLEARGKQMTSEQLNEKYPGHRFDKGMSDLTAQFKVDQEVRAQELQKIIDHGNTGFMKGTVLPFAVSMGAVISDPIGASVGFATAGLGRVATAAKFASAGRIANIAKLAKGGRVLKATAAAGKAGKVATAGLGGAANFGINLAENIVGNTASEALVAAGAHSMYEEYTPEEFLNNAITSSLVFTTAMSGFGALVGRIGGRNVDMSMDIAETNLGAGKDPFSLTEELLNSAKTKSDIDPNFATSFQSTFKNLELDEAGGMQKAFKDVREAFAKGDIEQAELDSFMRKLDDGGFDPAKYGYAEDNPITPMSDTEIQRANDTMSSPESDYGFDADADALSKELDSLTPEQVDSMADARVEELTASDLNIQDEVAAKEISQKFAKADAVAKTQMAVTKAVETCLLGG